MTAITNGKRWISQFAMIALIALGASLALEIVDPQNAQAQSSVRPPANAVGVGGPVSGTVPGEARSNLSDAEMWRAVRKGIRGKVSIPDKQAGQLVQSEGDAWRAVKNGPIASWGVIAMGSIIGLLAIFYLIRGRIRVDHGMSGRTLTRFASMERIAHWLLAVSFITLALTGLNVTYGKYFLLPLLGKPAFALIAAGGKWLHNYVAFAYMVGLVMILVMWIKENFPNKHDIMWLIKGGGMLSKGVHPPAEKFNAGQKILFWLVIWGGLALSVTGIVMLFPFQIELPLLAMEPLQLMQFVTTWHAIIAMGLVVVVIAHIYIGTIGMEGAYDAMGTGEVDENWAKEHHSVWAKRMSKSRGKKRSRQAKAAPAE